MNWSNFFSMGGYAFYVWGSYLVALILIGGEILILIRRRKSLLQRVTHGHRLPGIQHNETTS
jgi:heme exporter protein D